jgi:hypothetical protein
MNCKNITCNSNSDMNKNVIATTGENWVVATEIVRQRAANGWRPNPTESKRINKFMSWAALLLTRLVVWRRLYATCDSFCLQLSHHFWWDLFHRRDWNFGFTILHPNAVACDRTSHFLTGFMCTRAAIKKLNSVALVRKRTIPTERPPLSTK